MKRLSVLVFRQDCQSLFVTTFLHEPPRRFRDEPDTNRQDDRPEALNEGGDPPGPRPAAREVDHPESEPGSKDGADKVGRV